MPPILTLSQTMVTRSSDGTVMFSDPESPIVVLMRIENGALLDLSIRPKHRNYRITSATLARIPVMRLRSLATATQHPNDHVWLARITPRDTNGSWTDAHWEEVLEVHRWAIETNRPGKGLGAISDFWNVSKNPTAKRWIAEARRRARNTHSNM